MYLTRIKKIFTWLLVGCYWFLFHAAYAGAQSIDQLVQEAEFIFEGKVMDVQYRFSQKSTGESSGTPYTFVTYQVYRVLKGNYGAGAITLRFIGGPSEDGVVFSMEGTPRFDLGDHDVLLVDQNGYELCPLVNCAQGRFRYINGLVVNEYGQLIELNNGQLQLGKMIDLDEVANHKMGDMNLTRREMKNVDGEEMLVALPKAKVNTGLMPDPAGFTSYVQDKIYANHDASELAALPHYNSEDSGVAFTDELLERIYTPAEEPTSMKEPEPAISVTLSQEPEVTAPVASSLSLQPQSARHLESALDAEMNQIAKPSAGESRHSWYAFILVISAVLLFLILAPIVRHKH